MVASIQAGQQNQSQTGHVQVSQGGQGSYSTQSTQQVGSLSNQSGSQIITVSQQQPPQIIQGGTGNLHQGSNVVPLQISARSGNIPIKTITVSTANTGGLDSLHRNLSSNAGNMQATTIMPIAKLVQSQQQQNLGSGQNSNQPTSVFIQTRIPSSTMTTTNSNQVVSVSTPSSTIFSSAGTTVFYEPASVSIAPSSSTSHGNIETKSTSITTPSNESSSYTVVSAPNIRYTDKMIQSIIANSYSQANSANNVQQQSSVSVSQPHQQTIRYSPLVVESQNTPSQSQQHQIITMAPGNIIQQAASQQQQHQQLQNTSIESSVITALPSSPRSTVGTIRKQNETTPIKIPKKTAKVSDILSSFMPNQFKI
jgi:hypothetical protein